MNKINFYLNNIILSTLLLCFYAHCPRGHEEWKPTLLHCRIDEAPDSEMPRSNLHTTNPVRKNLVPLVAAFKKKVQELKESSDLNPWIDPRYLVLNSKLSDLHLYAIYTAAAEDFVRDIHRLTSSSEDSEKWHAIRHLVFIHARLRNCVLIDSIPYNIQKSILTECIAVRKNLQELEIQTPELDSLARIILRSLGKNYDHIVPGGTVGIEKVSCECDLSFLSPLVPHESYQAPVVLRSNPRLAYAYAGWDIHRQCVEANSPAYTAQTHLFDHWWPDPAVFSGYFDSPDDYWPQQYAQDTMETHPEEPTRDDSAQHIRSRRWNRAPSTNATPATQGLYWT